MAVDNIHVVPYTTVLDLHDKDLRIGFTLNNNPTVQDPYNTTPAWEFRYIDSAIAPSPAAETMLSSGFNQNAIGYTVYAWYDSSLYLEAGAYNTMSSWTLARIGTSYGKGSTTSPAPYVRIAYEWNLAETSAHVGFLFMHANVNPSTEPLVTTGAAGTDRYSDYAFDAGFQFLGSGKHIATAQTIYTHETQNLGGSAGLQGLGYGTNSRLNDLRANVWDRYDNTYGLTLGWQRIWGPQNLVLYPVSDPDGNPIGNGKPNSNAFIVEAGWVPFGKEKSLWRPLMNLSLVQDTSIPSSMVLRRTTTATAAVPPTTTPCCCLPG